MKHQGIMDAPGVPFFSVWVKEGSRRVELGARILSLSTSKSVTTHTGTWNATVLPFGLGDDASVTPYRGGEDSRIATLLEDLPPNTLVAIGVEERGGIMLGLIRRCDLTVVAVNGVAQVGLTLSGTDLGYLLTDQPVYASIPDAANSRWQSAIRFVFGEDAPFLRELMGAEGPVNAAGERSTENVSVGDMAEYIVSRVHGARIPALQATFGGSGTLADAAEFRVTSFAGDKVYKSGFFQQQNTVAGYLSEILDADFYEWRVESLPHTSGTPRPVLVVRPKPFDSIAFDSPAWPAFSRSESADWEQLTTFVRDRRHHAILPEDIIGKLSVGRSRDDVITYYTVTNNNELGITAADQARGMAFPIWDIWRSKTFPTRQYDSRVSLVPGDPKDSSLEGEIARSISERRNRLFCWRRGEPDFLTGSVEISGRDEIRAGDPIYFPWLRDALSGRVGVRGYCTAVTHTWRYGAKYVCTLSVGRGHGPGFWAELEKRAQLDMPAEAPYGWLSV